MVFNGAQIHLLINHFPVILPLVGCALLIASAVMKSNDLRHAAFCVFVISGLAAWASYLSGEPAEDVVKNYPGVTRMLIHEHQNAATFAWVFAMAVGIASAVALGVEQQKKRALKPFTIGLILASLLGFSMMARTAHLGGLIRHEEIRGVAP